MKSHKNFRVYSFLDKSFIYFDLDTGYPEGVAGGVGEVQQNTGLKDANKTPIFEGDIIDFTARYKIHGPTEVIYYGGSYGCNIINESSGSKEFWLLNHIVQQYYPKVIGNIYQLPCSKPNSFDHNGECLFCDCWATDCPLIKK